MLELSNNAFGMLVIYSEYQGLAYHVSIVNSKPIVEQISKHPVYCVFIEDFLIEFASRNFIWDISMLIHENILVMFLVCIREV